MNNYGVVSVLANKTESKTITVSNNNEYRYLKITGAKTGAGGLWISEVVIRGY